MTTSRETPRPNDDVEPATPAEIPSDCEPAMPRTVPFAHEVNAYVDRFNGRFISDVPTRGLL